MFVSATLRHPTLLPRQLNKPHKPHNPGCFSQAEQMKQQLRRPGQFPDQFGEVSQLTQVCVCVRVWLPSECAHVRPTKGTELIWPCAKRERECLCVPYALIRNGVDFHNRCCWPPDKKCSVEPMALKGKRWLARDRENRWKFGGGAVRVCSHTTRANSSLTPKELHEWT